MRGFIIFLIAIVVVGYASSKAATAFRTKNDFVEHLQTMFDTADNTSVNSLKNDLLQEAKRAGVEVDPANVQVNYVDTDDRTVGQKFVGEKFAQYKNKRLSVALPYTVRVMGFAWRHEYLNTKIVQIQVRRADPGGQLQELLQ